MDSIGIFLIDIHGNNIFRADARVYANISIMPEKSIVCCQIVFADWVFFRHLIIRVFIELDFW